MTVADPLKVDYVLLAKCKLECCPLPCVAPGATTALCAQPSATEAASWGWPKKPVPLMVALLLLLGGAVAAATCCHLRRIYNPGCLHHLLPSCLCTRLQEPEGPCIPWVLRQTLPG